MWNVTETTHNKPTKFSRLYGFWYCIKGILSFFFLAVWEHGTNSGKAERNLVPLNFSLSLLFSSYAVLSYAMLLFYLSQRLLSESVESKMMPFTFKEAWRELFQGSACDELNLIFFFFSSGRGSHRRVCLQGVPFKLLYRWLSQLDAACIAIVLNSTFKEQFNILTEVLAKLSQFWHCNGRSVLWNWWKEIF